MLDAGGDWVSGKEIEEGRFIAGRASNKYRALPAPLREVIESKPRVGFRLRRDRLV